MKAFFSSSLVCILFGLLAILVGGARGQEGQDSTTPTDDSGVVVLRVTAIRSGMEPAGPSTAAKPSADDGKSDSPRWEKVVVDDRQTFRTKDWANSRTITVTAEKVVYKRYVTLGVHRVDTGKDYLDNYKTIQAVSDKPIEKKIDAGSNYYKGLIQIGLDPTMPEQPTFESVQDYDKLKFSDGSVFIVKIVKAK